MGLMIDNRLLTQPNWNVPDHIVAFTTQISGGVSGKPYHSLNVGDHVGDIHSDVEVNRGLLPYSSNIHWLNQTHSDVAVQLPSGNKDADAAYTTSSNLACSVMTADCLPILLTDTEGHVVCAIHAGWKGLLVDIIRKTIDKAFFGIPRNTIIAWVGPSIRQCHYEVDSAMAIQFDHYSDAYVYRENPKKAMLNLSSIACQQLDSIGIESISVNAECTYCESEKYFSFRRASHQGFNNCGRMISMIMKRK